MFRSHSFHTQIPSRSGSGGGSPPAASSSPNSGRQLYAPWPSSFTSSSSSTSTSAASNNVNTNSSNHTFQPPRKRESSPLGIARNVPHHIEALRLVDMAVTNLRSLFHTRAGLIEKMHRQQQQQQQQQSQTPPAMMQTTTTSPPSSQQASSATPPSQASSNKLPPSGTSSSPLQTQLDTVNRMINHLVAFAILNLQNNFQPPLEPFQETLTKNNKDDDAIDSTSPTAVADENELVQQTIAAAAAAADDRSNSQPNDDELSSEQHEPSFVKSFVPVRIRSRPTSSAPKQFHHTLASDSTTAPQQQQQQQQQNRTALCPLESLLDLEKQVVKEQTAEAEQQSRRSLSSVARSAAPLTLTLAAVRGHFHALFATSSHPYGVCVGAFVAVMMHRGRAGGADVKWIVEVKKAKRLWLERQKSTSQQAALLQSPAADTTTVSASSQRNITSFDFVRSHMHSYLHDYLGSVRLFLHCHFRLVLASYPFLTHATAIRTIAQHSLHTAVFDGLAATIRDHYRHLFAAENRWMVMKLNAYRSSRLSIASASTVDEKTDRIILPWKALMNDLGLGAPWTEMELDNGVLSPSNNAGENGFAANISPRNHRGAFSSSLSLLQRFFTVASIYEKIDLLAAVCREINSDAAILVRRKRETNRAIKADDVSLPPHRRSEMQLSLPSSREQSPAGVPSRSASVSPSPRDESKSTKSTAPINIPRPVSSLSHATPFSSYGALNQLRNSLPTKSQSPSRPPSPGIVAPRPTRRTSIGETDFLVCSDDLVSLLAAVILQLPPTMHDVLYSDVRMIEEHLTEEGGTMGQKAFSLTTLSCALQCIVELVSAEQKMG